jgi:hypothetical protein
MATESTASHLVAATETFWWLTGFGAVLTGLTECGRARITMAQSLVIEQLLELSRFPVLPQKTLTGLRS